MKIIGIRGMSGAGKTTLSRMIKECDLDNIDIIHLDDVWEYLKKKVFKKHTTIEYDNSNNPIVRIDNRSRQRILSNRIGRFLVEHREIFTNLFVQREFEKHKKRGKKAIIIEGDVLDAYSIAKKCDAIVEIRAPYHERVERVENRSGEQLKEELVLRDRKFQRIKKISKRKCTYCIENNGDIDSLRKAAMAIYEREIEEKTPKISNPWKVMLNNGFKRDTSKFKGTNTLLEDEMETPNK